MAAEADIGIVSGRTGISIAAVRLGLRAGIGTVGLTAPGGQVTDRYSIMRMAPWTAGPEAIVMLAAASGPMVTIMDTAAVALALVLTQTVVDSAVVIVIIVAMTTPSALPPGADSLKGVFQKCAHWWLSMLIGYAALAQIILSVR